MKNRRAQPSCVSGCDRPAFGSFATCCTRCCGTSGPHTADCARKAQAKYGFIPASADVPTTPAAAAAAGNTAPSSGCLEDVEESLRVRLTEWRDAGAMRSPAEVDAVIGQLAGTSQLEPQAVRMLWLSVARQARPVGGPADEYITLAKRHHDVEVDVFDLGQYSAERSNSCMFLTCAASIGHRRLQGFADAELPGVFGTALEDEGLFHQTSSIEDLIAEHSRTRLGTLGRMADALRHAACEVLLHDQDFYLPFFHPIRAERIDVEPSEDFCRWVHKLRGDEEGDELVILALARLCGMAVQAVQRSGYRVPLMDPTSTAESGCLAYWGNDDKHWVWLRPKSG